MRLIKITTLFSILILFNSAAWALNPNINPKIKTIGLNAVYGSVGGALLGISSLAFGAQGRVVAKGASLGLYCGLAFGVYVVMTHGRGYGGMGGGGSHYVPDNTNLYDREEGTFHFKSDGWDVHRYGHPLRERRSGSDFYLRFFQYQF